MAKKRLNKKVALIGSVVFVLVALLCIFLILYLNRDPGKYIKDGDEALAAAMQARDEKNREQQFEAAERDYRQAYSLAKTDALKIKVLFKLAELYSQTDQWRKVVRCWNEVVSLSPKNARARYAWLKYIYLLGDSGFQGAWVQAASQASEFLDIAEQQGILTECTAQWDPFDGQDKASPDEQLGPFLYLVRGRANYEMARAGASVDREQMLEQAMSDLKKVLEFDQDNVDAAWYLALATLTKGRIRAGKGEFEQRKKSAQEAVELLEHIAEVAAENPKAHINVLRMKLLVAQGEEYESLLERIKALEPEYALLVKKFPDNPDVYYAVARYYRLRIETLDKAIEAAEKAIEIEPNNVLYIRNAAEVHYSLYCIYGREDELHKSIKLASYAMTLPDAQDTPGPRQWTKRVNRAALSAFLAECYLDQVMEPTRPLSDAQKQQLLSKAEDSIREIEQLVGTKDSPEVLKWIGLLELAKGDRASAIRKMYAAYEQLKSIDRKDALLSYRLAKAFENSTELGAVKEFFESALIPSETSSGIDVKKPQSLLDYAEVLIRLGGYGNAVSVVDFYERKYHPDERSWGVKVGAYIRAGQFDKAEQELAKAKPEDPNAAVLKLALLRTKIRWYQRALSKKELEASLPVQPESIEEIGPENVAPNASVEMMRTEMQSCWAELTGLVNKMLQTEPNSVNVSTVIAVCNHWVSQGKLKDAKALIEKYLRIFPDSTKADYYRLLLNEPEPTRVTDERRRQLEEQALSNISDPARRAINLGKFYYDQGQLDKAAEQFEMVFNLGDPNVVEEFASANSERQNYRRVAAGYLFEIAISKNDFDLAERIAKSAGSENLDDCKGQFYSARIAVAKQDYETALRLVNECIRLRPVFSQGYFARANIYAALGNESAAIEDAQKAASLNPLDGTIARGLATLLYQRNKKLGRSVTSDQVVETRQALDRAVRLNPGDLKLRSFYAEYISEENPQQALAIRQELQKVAPSVENALLLGRMAMRMGLAETDEAKRKALLDMAEAAFEQARQLGPQNKAALAALAEYYRQTGQEEKARQLLAASSQKDLLWAHYYRIGEFGKAKEVLQKLYDENPKDESVVRGLLLIADKTGDSESVKKYSEQLLSLNDNVDNRLLQIQLYLKAGLVKEAENKVESFKEKFKGEPRGLLLESWLAMKQGRLQEALDLVNQSLGTGQESAAAWQLRGRIYLLMGDYTQAVNDLRKSKSLSDDPETRFYLARAYLRENRVDDAVTELKTAITDPQVSAEAATIGRAARVLLERIYLRSGRVHALSRFYEETLEKLPDSLYWHNQAAAFALSRGQAAQAEQLYAKAMQIAQDKGLLRTGGADREQFARALDGYLHSLVLQAGVPGGNYKPEKLNKVFEIGSKYSTDSYLAPIAYLRMAEARIKRADKAKAAEYWQAALVKAFSQQGWPFAQKVLSEVCSLVGSEDVIGYLKKKLNAKPKSVALNLAMFGVLRINGQYNEALSYIDRCIDIVGPSDERVTNFVARKAEILTLAFERTSDKSYLEKAIKQYKSLAVKMPTNMMVLNNLAYMLAVNDEALPEALKYAERAYKALPNHAGILDTYGYVLYKNGRYKEAERFLQASLQQYEQAGASTIPAEVYEHIGLVKEKLGAKAEALEAYRQALEQGGEQLSRTMKKRIESAIERLRLEGAGAAVRP